MTMHTIKRLFPHIRPLPAAMRRLVQVLGLAALFLAALPAGAADSAVVLIYHRFGETEYPSTNIRLEQFDQHIAALQEGGYTVLPLEEIVTAIRSGTPLPDKAVAITIDDAFLSVYAEAWPRLKRAGLPFTLFVATGPVDKGTAGYMTWDQVREMRDGGVTIGAHSAEHGHMAGRSNARNAREIAESNGRFVAELGAQPSLFAYPFGEASSDLIAIVAEAGFTAAFGQHSGAMDRHAPQFYLPRFPVNETYGDLDRFRRVVNSLAIPVEGLTPADPLILQDNPPAFGFSVVREIPRLSELACYHSQSGKVDVQQLGALRFEVRFNQPFPNGRSRLNCTVPAEGGRWRWFGTQFYVPPR